MTRRQRYVAILIGIPGAIASLIALSGFLLKVLHNALPRPPGSTMQSFYLAVGQAYSGGFVHGFSLCFFLTLLAVAVGSYFDRRREERLRPAPAVIAAADRS
jgi:hypothetical protein